LDRPLFPGHLWGLSHTLTTLPKWSISTTPNITKTNKISNNIENNEIHDREKEKDSQNDSIMEEYYVFKTEDKSDYQCYIPDKYQQVKKLLSKEYKNNGQLIKYYEDSIKEVHYRKNNYTRVLK